MIDDINTTTQLETIEENKEERNKDILENTINLAESIFVNGDVQVKSLRQVLEESSNDKHLHRKELLSLGLSFIYQGIPKNIKKHLNEKAFEGIPIDIPEIDNYRVMERIGSGGMNIIYFLDNNERGSFAVGIKREGFANEREALDYATRQISETKYFKELYKDIPNFVPEENYSLFENYKGETSLMFIRKYVPTPIQDLFTISKEDLENIVSRNNLFKNQLLKFSTISLENSQIILDKQLDLLGPNNIAVAGEKGKERLVMLDPQTIVKKSPKFKIRIENRLNQLKEMVNNEIF